MSNTAKNYPDTTADEDIIEVLTAISVVSKRLARNIAAVRQQSKSTEGGKQNADDVEFDVLYPDPELAFKTKMADIPLVIQKMIFGNRIDDNGVLIRSATDKPPYFAVGFMSEKSNHKFRYVWLFKVRAKPVTESYATKEGGTITRQTGEIEWTAIKRTHDGQYQAVADEDENGFTAAKGATFLQSVYEPTFASTGT